MFQEVPVPPLPTSILIALGLLAALTASGVGAEAPPGGSVGPEAPSDSAAGPKIYRPRWIFAVEDTMDLPAFF